MSCHCHQRSTTTTATHHRHQYRHCHDHNLKALALPTHLIRRNLVREFSPSNTMHGRIQSTPQQATNIRSMLKRLSYATTAISLCQRILKRLRPLLNRLMLVIRYIARRIPQLSKQQVYHVHRYTCIASSVAVGIGVWRLFLYVLQWCSVTQRRFGALATLSAAVGYTISSAKKRQSRPLRSPSVSDIVTPKCVAQAHKDPPKLHRIPVTPVLCTNNSSLISLKPLDSRPPTAEKASVKLAWLRSRLQDRTLSGS